MSTNLSVSNNDQKIITHFQQTYSNERNEMSFNDTVNCASVFSTNYPGVEFKVSSSNDSVTIKNQKIV